MPVLYIPLEAALRINGTLDDLINGGNAARLISVKDEEAYRLLQTRIIEQLEWSAKIHKDYKEKQDGISKEKGSGEGIGKGKAGEESGRTPGTEPPRGGEEEHF